MNCPIDGDVLLIAERKGIEIDYCPRCRGVWLDRGELDKLIEAADRSNESGRSSDDRDRRDEPRRDDRGDDRQYREQKSYKDESHQQPKKKKASSFLGELFELGG